MLLISTCDTLVHFSEFFNVIVAGTFDERWECLLTVLYTRDGNDGDKNIPAVIGLTYMHFANE